MAENLKCKLIENPDLRIDPVHHKVIPLDQEPTAQMEWNNYLGRATLCGATDCPLKAGREFGTQFQMASNTPDRSKFKEFLQRDTNRFRTLCPRRMAPVQRRLSKILDRLPF